MSKNKWSNQNPRVGFRAARGFGKNITHTQVGLPKKVDESIPVTTPEKPYYDSLGRKIRQPMPQGSEQRHYEKSKELPKHYTEIRSDYYNDSSIDNPPPRDVRHTVMTLVSHTAYMESVERAKKAIALREKIRKSIRLPQS